MWPGALTKRMPGATSGSPLHLANVFPGREHGLNAPRQSLPGFRQPVDDRRIGPELVFHVGDDDLRVREYRLVGVLFHQPENMIGMAVRDENGVDRGGVDTRRFHVGHHLAGGWLHLSPGAAVAQDGLAAISHHHHRERNGDEIGGQTGLRHRAFDVVHRGIGDEGGIVRFFPDAVIERGDVSPADFVSHKSFCGVRRLLRKGRRYREPAIEAKRDRKASGNDEVASRQVEHGPSPSRYPNTDAGAHCADGIRTRHPGRLFPLFPRRSCRFATNV